MRSIACEICAHRFVQYTYLYLCLSVCICVINIACEKCDCGMQTYLCFTAHCAICFIVLLYLLVHYRFCICICSAFVFVFVVHLHLYLSKICITVDNLLPFILSLRSDQATSQRQLSSLHLCFFAYL